MHGAKTDARRHHKNLTSTHRALGFGNAVLEAMSFGTPALVSRYTAQLEVVGTDGFVCMELTKEGIQKAIAAFVLLTDRQIIELRARVAHRAKMKFGFANRMRVVSRVVDEVITVSK